MESTLTDFEAKQKVEAEMIARILLYRFKSIPFHWARQHCAAITVQFISDMTSPKTNGMRDSYSLLTHFNFWDEVKRQIYLTRK